MKSILKVVSLILFFSLSSEAKVGIFLEPYIGVSKLETEVTFEGSTSGTEDVNNGFMLGAKLALRVFKNYFIGGEFFQGGPYDEVNGPDTNTTNRGYGPMIGADFKAIRISASYFLSSKLDADLDSSSSSFADIEGTAIRVGFALPIARSKFMANLDVFIHFLDNPFTTADLSAQTAVASLSFPIEF